jgi:hypothetical protein
MVELQIFIWLTLVGTTLKLSWPGKCLASIFGTLAALAGFLGVVVLIETLQLIPHKGFLKIAVILLPFLVYYLLCFPQKIDSKKDCGLQLRLVVSA